ncbi:sugar ABC transporter permease [Phytomonospora endophytica]|uniref:Arabinogalactan oligomer/maltooligosaccharide transport system permease protein n=1 Tax=Phytomonospora endophytica TaxID=714109 RepID=A0A841FPW2_9ACTN|nr:sugar ABC transporter permease [Phytomonospora endophytica]MBB6035307.1 arabinogalactan oligomer/maltooligosaccharide transport system permease protein [Phytomonospora endophytica]GIG63944.1 sugar ABC transporter permease [Phytomonospora endophytica]
MSARSKTAGRNWWRHLILILAVVFALVPIVFVVSAALNPQGTLSSTGLIPTDGVSLSNVGDLFANTPFAHWYLNSIIVSGSAAFISIFISAIAAYAFSRFRFAGRRVGLMSLLLIQMFPQFLAIVALFLMFSEVTELWPAFGFNTLSGLTLVYLGGALGVNTWLMKGFFDTVPKELDESAVMDGASHTQVFFRIILPLVAPILAVTGLLAFIGTINEYLIANVFLTQPENKTLAIGLFGLINETNRNANFGIFAVGTLLTAIPTVAVFQLLQRYIVGGLTVGAVKG